VPRPSSPLNAKASVRSPYALDRSQQNPCAGMKPPALTPPKGHLSQRLDRPRLGFVFIRQTMSSSGPPSKLWRSRANPSFTMSSSVPPQARGETVFLRSRPRALRDPCVRRACGGARRDRTDDLMLAKHALYQLSYGPPKPKFRQRQARAVSSPSRSVAR
jgi:hypothetical protein